MRRDKEFEKEGGRFWLLSRFPPDLDYAYVDRFKDKWAVLKPPHPQRLQEVRPTQSRTENLCASNREMRCSLRSRASRTSSMAAIAVSCRWRWSGWLPLMRVSTTLRQHMPRDRGPANTKMLTEDAANSPPAILAKPGYTYKDLMCLYPGRPSRGKLGDQTEPFEKGNKRF